MAGARLTELARAAGMSKQAMGTLVNQCEAWGMVRREDDAADARARRVVFSEAVKRMVSAFLKRAQDVYGAPPADHMIGKAANPAVVKS